MSWYYPDAPYLHRCWALRVVWCLDSPCGGSITGSLVLHLSLCSWSQYQRGLSFWLMCVWTWCIGCLCGKKSRVLPVCCIILRYKLHELIICIGDNRYLHVWYYPVVSRAHTGCLGVSCCVICFSCLGCIRLVSYYESLCWPMYGWCTGARYSVVVCLCSVNTKQNTNLKPPNNMHQYTIHT